VVLFILTLAIKIGVGVCPRRHDYDRDTIKGEPEQVTVEEAFDYAEANCVYDKPTVGDFFENDLLL